MSMKFSGRDFEKNPLTRKDTQWYPGDPESPDEAPFRAQQSHNEGGRLDTTALVAQAFAGRVITHTRDATARFIDSTAFTDFTTAMNVKVRADEAFNNLPAEVRKQFATQKEFVEFVLDEKNLDKLREWGLVEPLKMAEPSKPMEVIVIDPKAPDEPKKPA